MPLTVTPPDKFYKWDGVRIVETAAEDPNRFVLKSEAELAIRDRVFVSAFIGIASAVFLQRLFRKSSGR